MISYMPAKVWRQEAGMMNRRKIKTWVIPLCHGWDMPSFLHPHSCRKPIDVFTQLWPILTDMVARISISMQGHPQNNKMWVHIGSKKEKIPNKCANPCFSMCPCETINFERCGGNASVDNIIYVTMNVRIERCQNNMEQHPKIWHAINKFVQTKILPRSGSGGLLPSLGSYVLILFLSSTCCCCRDCCYYSFWKILLPNQTHVEETHGKS